MDLFTTSFERRGQGHATALLGAAEQFLGARARVKRLLAVTSPDEKAAASLLQNKFDFSRLNGRQTRLATADFPQLQVGGQGAARKGREARGGRRRVRIVQRLRSLVITDGVYGVG
jgi:hypothetical protein